MAKWREPCTECARLRAEAANSAAQRDEAEKRADVAEEARRAVEADLEGADAVIEMQNRAVNELRAELARRDAAERNHTAAKLSAAKDMREGRG